MRTIYRLSLLVLVFSVLSACAAAAPRYISPWKLDSEAQRHATVAVHVKCLNLGTGRVESWRGSGVITGTHTILTANHVADCPSGLSEMYVELLNGTLIDALVVAQADEHDIAKLEAEESLPWFSFNIGPRPQPGDIVCSESAIPTRARKCGAVTYITNEASDQDIRIKVDVVGGNSGSGVFNERGHLVGIVTKRYMFGSGGTAASLWSHRDVMGTSY